MMYTNKQIKLAYKNNTLGAIKNNMIEHEIAKRYSIGTQIAILRQAAVKPEEYAEFSAYAEECKNSVKAYLSEVLDVGVDELNQLMVTE